MTLGLGISADYWRTTPPVPSESGFSGHCSFPLSSTFGSDLQGISWNLLFIGIKRAAEWSITLIRAVGWLEVVSPEPLTLTLLE